MSFFSELYQFSKTRKKFMLIPLIMVSLVVGFLVVFAGGSVVAPFVYTLF